MEKRAENTSKKGRKNVTERQKGEIKALIAADNASKTNSQRAIARKTKLSLGAVNRAIKDLGLKPLKLALTAKNAAATLRKRRDVAQKIVDLFDKGDLRCDQIFFSGETWIDQDCD